MMKRTVCFVWTILLIAMTLCPAWAEADDPVVVRVGGFSFTKSQMQSAVDTDIELTEILSNQAMTDEEKQAQREETIERFVGVGLIQCKLQEAGQNDFTPEEEENLKAAARNLYEQLWQGIWQRAQASDGGFTEAQVTEYLAECGYSAEAIFEEYKNLERRYRVIDLYCPAMALTEDMVREYYENQFLNPDRARYENDIDLYEQEILAQHNESFYTPAGYRAIQQILINYPDEVNKGLAREKVQFSAAGQAVASALQTLANAATTAQGWDDISEACASYAEAAKALEAVQAEIVQKREALAMPLVQTTLDEIKTRFDAGIDFASLIDKYSADKSAQNKEKGGYPIHPDSKNWPTEFLQAASALEKPGDISDPVLTDMGVHILYYASDIPEGAHELTGEEQKTLNTSALNYYRNQALEALMVDWRGEYEIETHPELLDD